MLFNGVCVQVCYCCVHTITWEFAVVSSCSWMWPLSYRSYYCWLKCLHTTIKWSVDIWLSVVVPMSNHNQGIIIVLLVCVISEVYMRWKRVIAGEYIDVDIRQSCHYYRRMGWMSDKKIGGEGVAGAGRGLWNQFAPQGRWCCEGTRACIVWVVIVVCRWGNSWWFSMRLGCCGRLCARGCDVSNTNRCTCGLCTSTCIGIHGIRGDDST